MAEKAEKIEQYLIELMVTYRKIGKDMWLLDDSKHRLAGIVIMYNDPLVIFRVQVMDAPRERRLELFTELLELNASDILHGAYALEKDTIVLIDTLEYNGMDFAEFRATLDSFELALVQHYPILSPYRT